MKLRRIWTAIFEFYMIRKLRLSKEEIQATKRLLFEFQNSITSIESYGKNLQNLKSEYPWVSDPRRGLIDWSPSLKNLHVFFCHRSSRDCDDFASLAYHTLRLKVKDYEITEWCIFVDKKVRKSHMIITARKKGIDNWYIFDNHNTYTSTRLIREEFDARYGCDGRYAKYR